MDSPISVLMAMTANPCTSRSTPPNASRAISVCWARRATPAVSAAAPCTIDRWSAVVTARRTSSSLKGSTMTASRRVVSLVAHAPNTMATALLFVLPSM